MTLAPVQVDPGLNCTEYASTLVIKQLKLADKVKNIRENEDYLVETSEGERVVSCTGCGCIFHNSMLLPCRHMFALRIKLGEPLFDPNICDKRWTSAYYRSMQRLFSNSSSQPSVAVVEASSKHKRKLSQHEKYRKALLLTSELASVASGASHIHFHRRMKLLKELIEHWKCGEEVGLVDLDLGIL